MKAVIELLADTSLFWRTAAAAADALLAVPGGNRTGSKSYLSAEGYQRFTSLLAELALGTKDVHDDGTSAPTPTKSVTE